MRSLLTPQAVVGAIALTLNTSEIAIAAVNQLTIAVELFEVLSGAVFIYARRLVFLSWV